MYQLIASSKVFDLVLGYLEKSHTGYAAPFLMFNQVGQSSSPASHTMRSILTLSMWLLAMNTIVAASAAFFFIV
ncbi:hypothetical protein JST56_05035 [Candidatus Dependentiae bacterium]|jgi:hypothetical protein|nr:hypothetical protein [Candidatus Dependentiae bacterium]